MNWNRLTSKPIRKKFILLGVLFFVFITLILAAGITAMKFQSAMRTFVGGEGLYSKAQKAATYDLLRYATTENETYYESYQAQIDVTLGIRDMFTTITSDDFDPAFAEQGYLRGHNNILDGSAVIIVRITRHFAHINKSIEQWRIEDELYISHMETIAKELHEKITTGTLTEDERANYITELDRINNESIIYQNGYSAILGAASRWVNNLFTWLMLCVTILGLLISFAAFFIVAKDLTKNISMLHHASQKVSGGEFKTRVQIATKDELGELGETFNQMTEHLASSYSEIQRSERALQKAQRQLKHKVVELEKANAKLKALDKQKDEFVSVAAHELKTPLTSIKGYAQLLENKKNAKDPAKRDQYIKSISKNTSRLYDLVIDIVDSSRLSMGSLKIEKEAVNVNDVLKEAKETMDVIMRQNKLQFIVQAEKKLPTIKADYKRTLQVLRNLLINAVHYTQENGSITLKATKKGKMIEFAVADNGEGIPKDKQAAIFSKFYQADSSRSRKVMGSGLGLSICKGLVEQMGGKIGFTSTPGKGTTFSFTLPVNAGKKKNSTRGTRAT